MPRRIPHDFRRTAVRNLERAGGPRSAAMKMVGHKTEAIHRRYAIADEGMLREAAVKLEALLRTQRNLPPVVIPLRTDKVGGFRGAERLSAAELGVSIENEMVG